MKVVGDVKRPGKANALCFVVLRRRVYYVLLPVDADFSCRQLTTMMWKVRNMAFPAVLLSRGRVIPHEGCRYSIPAIAFTTDKINARCVKEWRVLFCGLSVDLRWSSGNMY